MSTGTDCTGDVLEDLLLTTTLIRTSLNRQCRAFPVLGRLDHHPLMARFSSHVETTVECGVALTDWMLSLHRFETERDKITIWPPLPINEFSKKPRPSQPFCGQCAPVRRLTIDRIKYYLHGIDQEASMFISTTKLRSLRSSGEKRSREQRGRRIRNFWMQGCLTLSGWISE